MEKRESHERSDPKVVAVPVSKARTQVYSEGRRLSCLLRSLSLSENE